MFEKRRWNHGNVTKGCAAKVGEDRLVGLSEQPFRLTREVGQALGRDGAEFLQVVLWVQHGLVEGLLTNYGVEVIPPVGHPPAGGYRAIALGIHQNVAIRFRLRVKRFGY